MSRKQLLNVIEIGCNLFIELHQHIFSSALFLRDQKSKQSAVLQSGNERIALFHDCAAITESETGGSIEPHHPSFFQGWEPARFCRVPVTLNEQRFDRAYLLYSLPFMEHLHVCWMEKNAGIDFFHPSANPLNAFTRDKLSEHLPIIADILVHEMRHEAQLRGGITVRNIQFLEKEYPQAITVATEALRHAQTRHAHAFNQEDEQVFDETDACIAGLAARWIWQNISSEGERLARAKALVLE